MTSLRITGSVGIAAQNNVNDVKAVQMALNALNNLLIPMPKLTVDGRLGSKPETSKTVSAIKLLQKKQLGMVNPDGKIDVNGNTPLITCWPTTLPVQQKLTCCQPLPHTG